MFSDCESREIEILGALDKKFAKQLMLDVMLPVVTQCPQCMSLIYPAAHGSQMC